MLLPVLEYFCCWVLSSNCHSGWDCSANAGAVPVISQSGPMSQPQLLLHADPAIARQIWQLGQQAYTVEAGLIGAANFPPLKRSAFQIGASQSSLFGIIESGELLAAAELEEGRDGLLISSFVVTSQRLRSGLGSRLLQGILDFTSQSCVRVRTAIKNTPAIKLYEKFGFKESLRTTSVDGVDIVTLQLIRATSS